MKRNIDGVRGAPDEPGDVFRFQIGSVTERDQFAVTRPQSSHGCGEVEPYRDRVVHIGRRRRVEDFVVFGRLLDRLCAEAPRQEETRPVPRPRRACNEEADRRRRKIDRRLTGALAASESIDSEARRLQAGVTPGR